MSLAIAAEIYKTTKELVTSARNDTSHLTYVERIHRWSGYRPPIHEDLKLQLERSFGARPSWFGRIREFKEDIKVLISTDAEVVTEPITAPPTAIGFNYGPIAKTAAALGVAAGIWYWATRNSYKVKVHSKPSPFDYNELKESFAKYKSLPHTFRRDSNPHSDLAFQRRVCEAFCVNVFANQQIRFRDVGGSKKRHQNLQSLKHLCDPTIDASDILRNDKVPNSPFHSCGKKGQHCSFKDSFEGALLCHVDYHINIDDIASMVVGPTFIINHKFNPGGGRFGYHKIDDQDVYEANYTTNKGIVEMQVNGGQHYKHKYYDWLEEGSVVSKRGAFSYIRIGQFKDTFVYYAYPAAGTYNSLEPSKLKPFRNRNKFHFGHNYHAEERDDDYLITQDDGNHKEDVITTVKSSVVHSTLAHLASAHRNEKWNLIIRNFVMGKISSEKLPQNHCHIIIEMIIRLADHYALNEVDQIQNFNLYSNWMVTRVYKRLMFNMSSFKKRFRKERMVNGWLDKAIMRICAPWCFKEIKMPGYVVNTHYGNVRLKIDHRPNQFFRVPCSFPNAGFNNYVNYGSSSESNEHDSQPSHSCISGSHRTDSNTYMSCEEGLHTLDSNSTSEQHITSIVNEPTDSEADSDEISSDSSNRSRRSSESPSSEHAQEEQQQASHDSDTNTGHLPIYTEFYLGPQAGAVYTGKYVLVINAEGGQATIHIPSNDTIAFKIVKGKSAQIRPCIEEVLKSIVANVKKWHWDRQLLPGFYRKAIEQGLSVNTVSNGVPRNTRDGMDEQSAGPSGIRQMGEEISIAAKKGADRGKGRGGVERRASEGLRREKFHKGGNNSQTSESQKHQPEVRPNDDPPGTVYRRSRGRGARMPISRKRNEPQAT